MNTQEKHETEEDSWDYDQASEAFARMKPLRVRSQDAPNYGSWPETSFIFMNDPQIKDEHGSTTSVLYSALVMSTLLNIPRNPTFVWPKSTSTEGQPISDAQMFGMFIQGDLTQDAAGSKWWDIFRSTFETGRHLNNKWSSFMGLGNHDLGGKKATTLMTNYIREMHKGKGRTAPVVPVASIDAPAPDDDKNADWKRYSYDYAVDAPHVHFVQLHRFGGDTRDERASGLGWLQQHLDGLNQQAPDKPIIVLQHFGMRSGDDGIATEHIEADFDSDTKWTQEEYQLLAHILTRYNVVGCIHGHGHSVNAVTPCPLGIGGAAANFMIFDANPGSVCGRDNNTPVDDDADPDGPGRHFGIGRVSQAGVLDLCYGRCEMSGRVVMSRGFSTKLSTQPKRTYTYVNLRQHSTGKNLDATFNKNAYTLAPNRGPYQEWEVWEVPHTTGGVLIVRFIHRATGLVLDGGHKDQVYPHRVNGGTYQRWIVNKLPEDPTAWVLVNQATGKILDAKENGEVYLREGSVNYTNPYQVWHVTATFTGN